MSEFSHWNEEGRAKMVDISQKDISTRTAVAQSTISLSNELFEAIQSGGLKKGDPLQVAQVAGIIGAKKTADIIPMCHPILIQGTDFTFHYEKTTDGYELIDTSNSKMQRENRCRNGSINCRINRRPYFLRYV